jgi:hypothetical protein
MDGQYTAYGNSGKTLTFESSETTECILGHSFPRRVPQNISTVSARNFAINNDLEIPQKIQNIPLTM